MTTPPKHNINITMQDRADHAVVAHVAIDHQAKLNVLNTPIIRQFVDALRALHSRDDVRAVVLTGEGGRAFIGGADINELATLDGAKARTMITGIHEICQAIRAIPVPVIARIDGYCLGAGLEVAAACDMRVASDTSKFGMPEVRVGLPSVIEAALLPGLIGWGKTRQLLLTGDMIDAAKALEWGLIERAVPRDALDDAVQKWLASIIQSAPHAVRLQKKLITQWENLSLTKAIDAGIDAFEEAFTTDEPTVFTKRFLDR